MRASAKELYWKIPLCYDDDDDYTIAITPVLPTKEPVNSLSMGDEHLDTIPATELDEVIKSSVENLVPIPMMPDGCPGFLKPLVLFVLSITRASHPQLHFGNPIS
ncbi:hypothetical protein Tco_0819479 [Tanacetum coccineum]|uniref:Uncharacterized protein n=1 Tax=Tanacetum coccineum TaxID=301880 RepID=A0ABQ5A6P5_9ASTR